MASELRSRAAAADGMTMIELLAAILVIAVAVLGAYGIFDTSNHAIHVSEVRESSTNVAQRELERVQSLPYAQVGLTLAPSVSTNPNNPDYYVSAGTCPTFTWNQSPGATNPSDQLVINGCGTYLGGTVIPSDATTYSGYTVYDFVTWVNDNQCVPGVGCPGSGGVGTNDFKRVTVEVTSNSSGRAALTPTSPVLVSAIVVDPHAAPVSGNPTLGNPVDGSTVTCTNGSGTQVSCNTGLGNQTANVFYLTDSPESSGYTAPSANNSCMHYTDQPPPLSATGVLQCGASTSSQTCSVTVPSACPQPDLLNSAPPSASIPQEYNFSPNISATTQGRVIKRDPNATGSTPCSATPSNDATMGQLWATQPLASSLNLSGAGGMTLYASTLSGASASVTLCVGVYLETPVQGHLDPLNQLGTADSTQLGVVAYTRPQWPGAISPISFTFSYMSAAQVVPAGSSVAVRLWVTAGSLADLVVQYDYPQTLSNVVINSQ